VFAAPKDAIVVGAGISFQDSYRAIFAWKNEKGVTVQTATSTDCGTWSAPADVKTAAPTGAAEALPSDVEDMSYLFDGKTHELYFTRPPNDEVGRTLWHARSTDGTTFTLDDGPVAELPDSVIAPVTIRRVGNDLVAVHPLSASAGATGIGALVATPPHLDEWDRVLPWPLLSPNQVTGAFDSQQLVAGALGGKLQKETRWPLVYSGRTGTAAEQQTGPIVFPGGPPPFPGVGGGSQKATLEVGTAFLTAGAAPSGGFTPLPTSHSSGDDPARSDATPPGRVLVSTTFDSSDTATWTSLDPSNPVSITAFGTGIFLSTAQLLLPKPVVGDFELRASVHGDLSSGLSIGVQSAQSGVGGPGAVSSLAAMFGPGGFVAPTAGYGQGPASYGDSSTPDQWRRFYLRRIGGALSAGWVTTSSCSQSSGSTLEFLGAPQNLGTLFVQTSPPNGIELDSVVLYGLGGDPSAKSGTPAACDASGRVSCSESGGSGCVTVATDGANCGGCNQVCPPNTECVGGACGCGNGKLCGSVCADVNNDPANCGGCGQFCNGRCMNGQCVQGADCNSPVPLATGQQLDVDLSKYAPYAGGGASSPGSCMGLYAGVYFASWVADADGSAQLSVTPGTVANVGAQGCYGTNLGCTTPDGSGQLTFPVQKGNSYVIGLSPGKGPATIQVTMGQLCPAASPISNDGTYPADFSANTSSLYCSQGVGPPGSPSGTPLSASGELTALFSATTVLPGQYDIRLDGVTGLARLGVIQGTSCTSSAQVCVPMTNGVTTTQYLNGGTYTFLVEHENPVPSSLTLTFARHRCAGEADLGSAIGSAVASGLMTAAPTGFQCSGPSPLSAYLYSWTAPAAATYHFDATASTFSADLGVFTGPCDSVQLMGGNYCRGGSGGPATADISFSAGQTAWIRILEESSPGANDQFSLSIMSQVASTPTPCKANYDCPPGQLCASGLCK
jgi:hypothetical protein